MGPLSRPTLSLPSRPRGSGGMRCSGQWSQATLQWALGTMVPSYLGHQLSDFEFRNQLAFDVEWDINFA